MEVWQWIVFSVSIIISWVLVFFCGIRFGEKLFTAPQKIQGIIRIAYDTDDPDHPAMGLMLESMDQILSTDYVYLKVEKKNFPE